MQSIQTRSVCCLQILRFAVQEMKFPSTSKTSFLTAFSKIPGIFERVKEIIPILMLVRLMQLQFAP